MLDGGHLVFYIIEFLIGKPIKKSLQEKIFKLGFAIIITLAVLLTYNDIISLFN
jgi:regulator of sigma E protease